MRYIALLRGVNVGGKAKLPMADLRQLLSTQFDDVSTYIQTGNIIFSATNQTTNTLATHIKSLIGQQFDLDVGVIVLSKTDWQKIISAAPEWWGKDDSWKHNLLVLMQPHTKAELSQAIGPLKADIEAVKIGRHVIYQSMSKQLFGRTTTSKLSSSPLYKQLTIRNYNTAQTIAQLLNAN